MARLSRLLVYTGAGVSAESGLPVFSGSQGLWAGSRVEDVCDAKTWRQNHAAVHAFYNRLRQDCAAATPNAAHEAIARWQRRWGARLVTQNIDGLLEKAGAAGVLHLHGRVSELRCEACRTTWEAEGPWDPAPDHCVHCGLEGRGEVRPAIVFYNEEAPSYASFNAILRTLREDDVVVVLGTSGQTVPIVRMLAPFPGFKIFGNLTQIPGAGEVFDHAAYGQASTVVVDIEALLEGRLG